jgi:hypothetical protein
VPAINSLPIESSTRLVQVFTTESPSATIVVPDHVPARSALVSMAVSSVMAAAESPSGASFVAHATSTADRRSTLRIISSGVQGGQICCSLPATPTSAATIMAHGGEGR